MRASSVFEISVMPFELLTRMDPPGPTPAGQHTTPCAQTMFLGLAPRACGGFFYTCACVSPSATTAEHWSLRMPMPQTRSLRFARAALLAVAMATLTWHLDRKSGV